VNAPTAAAITDAQRLAQESADRARVLLRESSSNAECAAASDLLATIWGTSSEASPASSDLLRSVAHAGGCIVGATDHSGTLVGVAVAFAGAPCADGLYSFIAGVAPGHPHAGVGTALKQYQRAWALRRGATTMTWTFDPLVRRNARFNLDRLGARITEYVPNFYPPMHDALNRADEPDRCTVVWDLVAPDPGPTEGRDAVRLLDIDGDGGPRVHPDDRRAPCVSARVPPDIENLRRHDPSLARSWRVALRDVLQDCLRAGYRVQGMTEDGCYVMVEEAR
jgi:predicted GNAT superfamily acetyltransferase